MLIKLELSLTETELEEFYASCKQNLCQRYEVNGCNMHPIYQQIKDQLKIEIAKTVYPIKLNN